MKKNKVRILVHPGSDGNHYWIIETREQINAAMRQLFNMLDAKGCYHDYCDPEVQYDLEAARSGEHMSIYRIIKKRQNHPGQEWHTAYATDPTVRVS